MPVTGSQKEKPMPRGKVMTGVKRDERERGERERDERERGERDGVLFG